MILSINMTFGETTRPGLARVDWEYALFSTRAALARIFKLKGPRNMTLPSRIVRFRVTKTRHTGALRFHRHNDIQAYTYKQEVLGVCPQGLKSVLKLTKLPEELFVSVVKK